AQARGADRAARFGAAGQHGGLADRLDQLLADAPRVGGFHPAAEPDAGGRDDDVKRVLQAAPRRLAQLAVVGERHDLDGGGGDYLRAAAFERGGELLPASRGRDANREPGQRLDRHLTVTSVSVGTCTSTCPSRCRTGKTGTRAVPPSRHAPVRRSKTCLCSGEATVGMSSLVPTMPRDST